MSDTSAALAANRAAVGEFITAAERAASRWTTARAAGKWSPAQVVEHVARSFEESAHEVAGVPSKFPTFPGFVRPLVRGVFFNRVLKRGAFPRARTAKAFDPESGPATTAEGRARVEAAFARFEQACRAAGTTMSSTLFGTVAVSDYVRFQELHTRHHQSQIASLA
jgi:hypothetical protein